MNEPLPTIGAPLTVVTIEQIRNARILLLVTRLTARQIAKRVGAPYEALRYHIGVRGKYKESTNPPAWAELVRCAIDQALAGRSAVAAEFLHHAADKLFPLAQNHRTSAPADREPREASRECASGDFSSQIKTAP